MGHSVDHCRGLASHLNQNAGCDGSCSDPTRFFLCSYHHSYNNIVAQIMHQALVLNTNMVVFFF